MSAFDKYNTPAPKINSHNVVDDPLIPKEGIPLSQDGLSDSTKINDDNVWQVDKSNFYDNSGLNGIDTNNQIDLRRFNKEFDRSKQIATNNQRLDELTKLNELMQENNKSKIKLYDQNISVILLNTKNTWFNVLDDILDQDIKIETFTKDNRLFYLGLTILFFSVIMYLYISLTNDK